MSAVRPEPAQVWLSEDKPARFVWRGRRYAVLSVLESPQEEAAQAWRCWRVTASPARGVPGSAFRLCLDLERGNWYLWRDQA